MALLNSIPVVSTSGLEHLIESNQRTMRKNDDIRIIRTAVNEDFFNMQRRFSMVRFGIPITADEEYIQRLIYGQHGFFVTPTFAAIPSLRGNCAILPIPEKTLMILACPDWQYKKRRIGYYSIIQNLLYAHKHQSSYSLDGGNYEYKREIIQYFLE